MKFANHQRLALLAAVLWAALIFWLSNSPDARGGGWLLGLFPYADKFAHAITFGILGALIYLGTGRVWLSVLLASLYGISDELHQLVVPGRSTNGLDWLADTLGAVIAIFTVRLLLVKFLTPPPLQGSKPVE